MVYSLSLRLSSTDPAVVIQALKDVARGARTEFAEDTLRVLKSGHSPVVRGRSAWALGRLRYKAALDDLLSAVRNRDGEVRRWSAWALGELGFSSAEPILRAIGNKETRPDVRSAVFGAIKKLNFDRTREHHDVVVRRLEPPKSNNFRINRAVRDLEALAWPEDGKEIVRLRKEIKEVDGVYFGQYMDWIRRRPTITAGLADNRFVFGTPAVAAAL